MQRINTSAGSLQLTRKTDYALMLLCELAKKDKSSTLSITTIAQANQIPLAFLKKIAAELQKGGLITASRGKYGGQTLAKPARKINIKEIVEIMEGKIAICQCSVNEKSCACSNKCGIKTKIQQLNEDIKNAFLSKTLDYFIS